jgi:hypothetical protein
MGQILGPVPPDGVHYLMDFTPEVLNLCNTAIP